MKYISTRGQNRPQILSEILLMGLAPDGGLMLPEAYPAVSETMLDQWRGLSYRELAFEIIRLFATDIPEADLRRIIDLTYTEEAFGSADITPVRTLKDGIKIQALSNGPTLAFKDMAMQFLGNAFEYVLNKENKQLNILGATSGDTGSDGGIRPARQKRRERVHALARRQNVRLPARANVQPARRKHRQYCRERYV